MIAIYLRVQLQAVREAIRVAAQCQQPSPDEQTRRGRAIPDRAARRRPEDEAIAAELIGPSVARPDRDPRRIPHGDSVRWWYVEPARSLGHPHPAYRHRGHTGFTRAEARLALADQQDGAPTVRPCPRCRPDFGLQ